MQKTGAPSLLLKTINGDHGFKSAIVDNRVKQFLDLHLRVIAAGIVTTLIVKKERRWRLFSCPVRAASRTELGAARSLGVKARPEARLSSSAGQRARSAVESSRSRIRLSSLEADDRRLLGLSWLSHLTFKFETGRFKSVWDTSWAAGRKYGSGDLPLSPVDRASPLSGRFIMLSPSSFSLRSRDWWSAWRLKVLAKNDDFLFSASAVSHAQRALSRTDSIMG